MGEFKTLLEQIKLKNSVYKDLNHVPHHKQEMEQLVDALGKQKVAKYLGSISYYSQKQSHGKLGALALCLFVLSPILYLQIKEGKKQWQEILVLTSLSLALSTFAAYCWWPKLISLFFHKEIEIYKQGVKMIEQNVELKDYYIIGQSNTRKKTAEEYIESIKGAVSAAEFKMHVKCLMSLEIGFSDYEYKLRNDKRLKGDQGVVRDFLNYVKEKRLNSTGLDQDVSKLRYCRQARDKGDISYSYNWLFRVTRQLLWKVKPYEFIKGKKTAIEHFSEKIKRINGNLTLREALEITCVLNHEDDVDELLRSLKVLLAAYHPDKNKAEKAREVYEQVEKVYRAVSTILEKYERLIGDRVYCDLKEFLEWKLRDISDEAVYGNMVSMVEPKTRVYKRKKGEYEEQKKAMLKIKDNILVEYRDMTTNMATLLEKAIKIPDYKQCIGVVEGYGVSREEVKKDLDEQYEKKIETQVGIEGEIKTHEERIQGLINELKLKMREILAVSETTKDIFTEEIENNKEKLGRIEDAFKRYSAEKQIIYLERSLANLNREKEDINSFLKTMSTRKERFQKKAQDIKEKRIGNGWTCAGILHSIKKIFNSEQSIRAEHSYIEAYRDLNCQYRKLTKEVKEYYFKVSNSDKYTFYKQEEVEVGKEAYVETIKNQPEKESLLKKYEYIPAQDFLDNKKQELKELQKSLSDIYKTQKEIEDKRALDLKENKEKLIHDKEKIKSLKKQLAENLAEIEETGIKVEAAESKAEEERVRAEEERVRAEEERVRAEAAEAKVEEAEAEKKAMRMVNREGRRRNLPLEEDDEEFFIAQFKLVVLYENVKNKFQDQVHKCVQLRKELEECEVIVDGAAQNPEEMSKEDIFERRLNLVKESDKIDEKLKKLNEEYAQEKPEFNDTKIQDFKNYALEKVTKAKEDAKHFEQMLQQELEKLQRVEEEKLQMQVEEVPDSDFNIVNLGQPCSSRVRTFF
ncbi:MAG: hypothetical protein U0X86_000696 [Wolbachia endosymbiont of Xenopsylla cheopis]